MKKLKKFFLSSSRDNIYIFMHKIYLNHFLNDKSIILKFEALDQLPYLTSMNIGLQSADPQTLDLIKKPVSAERVVESFEKHATLASFNELKRLSRLPTYLYIIQRL